MKHKYEYILAADLKCQDHAWIEISAADAEDAAEVAAKDYDSDDYSLTKNPDKKTTILVRRIGCQDVHRFAVSAEMSVSYNATELNEFDEGDE